MTDCPQFAKSYYAGFADLEAVVPEPMKRQYPLGQVCLAGGGLSVKIKDLIALSVAITMKCKGCIVHHAKALVAAGATRKEVGKMIAVTMPMGASRPLSMASRHCMPVVLSPGPTADVRSVPQPQ